MPIETAIAIMAEELSREIELIARKPGLQVEPLRTGLADTMCALNKIERAQAEQQVSAALAVLEHDGVVEHSVINDEKVYSLTRSEREKNN
jgi:hypothetical protein